MKNQLEEKYLMLQLIDAQIKELEKEITVLEKRNVELIRLRDDLESLKNIKEGSKAYSPLGLGVYLQSEIKNTKEVLVNVGSNVIVKKDLASAKELLGKQIEQSEEVILQLVQNLQVLAARAKEIEKDLQKLSGA